MAISDEIREYMAKHPDACVGELAQALKCSEQSIRRRSAEAGLKPRRTTAARMVDAAPRLRPEPTVTPDSVRAMVREVYEQEADAIVARLLARADVKTPTDDQVADILDTETGRRLLASAMRYNGSAALRAALHHGNGAAIKAALDTPTEDDAQIGFDPVVIEKRMRAIFGGRGTAVVRAFLRLLDDTGRKHLLAWIKSELLPEPKGEGA